jgi:import inner membrane translocase subunit TIM50
VAGPKAEFLPLKSEIPSLLKVFISTIEYTASIQDIDKMLRTATAAARLLARPPVRQLSTTPALQVRIRSSANPSGTSNPNPTTSSSAPPSPAEAPPSPPPETTDPSTFIPEVRQTNPTSSTQSPTPKTETTPPPLSESNTPLTPPEVEVEVDEVQIPVDGKYKLPSLDIDPEVALPEPVKEEGGSGKKRTGAGRKEYVSSIERQRKMWARMGLGAAGVAALVAAFYASQDEVRCFVPLMELWTGADGVDW